MEPGDGGLIMVNGSHKARFERPPSVGGTYGMGNWPSPLGVREEGFASEPHPEDNRLPPHTVNPCKTHGCCC